MELSVEASVPRQTLLETNPPVVFASQLALREGNRKKPIYQLHKWWARRLGSVFRSMILSAVSEGKASDPFASTFYAKHSLASLVVLDPFVGGGTSLVEAAKCGASVIGVDIDPVACFITAKELAPWDEKAFRESFAYVEGKVKASVLRWYATSLPDGRSGTIIYAFWVDVITCPDCQTTFDGHPHYQLFRDRRNKKQTVICAHCGEVDTIGLEAERLICTACNQETLVSRGLVRGGRYYCPSCGGKDVLRSLTSQGKIVPQRLFALEVLTENAGERVFKKADGNDLSLFAHAEREWLAEARNSKFAPCDLIPAGNRNDQRPLSYGYYRYIDLFNPRQLLCLTAIAEAIAEVQDESCKEYLVAAFSDCLATNNMFCFFAFDYRKLTPLFGLHAYAKVSRPVENNVWGVEAGRGSFKNCVEKVVRAKQYGQHPYEFRYRTSGAPERVVTGESVSSIPCAGLPGEHGSYVWLLNQSSESLAPLSDRVVDLILADPPYYNNLAYSELSDFYYVWLRRLLPSLFGELHHTPMADSLFVRDEKKYPNDRRRYAEGLANAFRECHRVLKDEGLMVFTYHHNEKAAWLALSDAIEAANFRVTSVFPVRSEGKSQFHSHDGNIKWDVVFCCRKKDSSTELAEPSMRSVAEITEACESEVTTWVRSLEESGFSLSYAEKQSLRYGLLVSKANSKDLSLSALDSK
jgi:putative DNA methylase